MKKSFLINLSRKALGAILCLAVLSAAMPVAALAEEVNELFAPATPAELRAFEPYEVDTVDPDLVKVNLFDYWVYKGRNYQDDIGYDKIAEAIGNEYGAYDGINADSNGTPHILHFVKSTANMAGPESKYTNSEMPKTGLVKNLLGEDGYPVAVKATNLTDAEGNPIAHPHPDMPDTESLAYLFDSEDRDGKQVWPDVKGLFQVDEDGYYYYNSMYESTEAYEPVGGYGADGVFADAYKTANYAYFDEAEKRFRLYNNWGITHNGGYTNPKENAAIVMSGQFYPFNKPSDAFEMENNLPKISDGKLVPKDGVGSYCTESYVNHYLGLSMEVPFLQTKNGKTGENEDTIFYFSGDDDMWLFIDGVLVGDIGGIHDATAMEINFAQGTVKINKGEEFASVYDGAATYKLYDLFKDALEGSGIDVNDMFQDVGGNMIFKDLSHHMIKMFFMERGNTASNLGIKFNLHTIPTSTLKKVDQDGKPLEGATYTIYPADKDYNYNPDPKFELYTGTTDENGEFHLVHPDGRPFSFNELEGDHFVMCETNVPDGYRSVGDMHLKKHVLEDGSVTLVSDPDSPTGSKWSTGSYATLQELVNVNANDVYLRADDRSQSSEKVVKNNKLVDGSMFAVVMKWIGEKDAREVSHDELYDHRNWAPVYGDADTGYHLCMPADESDDAYNAAIKEAVENTQYKFEKGASGRYEVIVEDMPGDILHYLHTRAAGDKEYPIQYTVLYGWADVDNLANIEGATRCVRLFSDNFTRSFSATFKAFNTQYDLHVIKTDENGKPLKGVTFGLFPKSYVEKDAETGKMVLTEAAWDAAEAGKIEIQETDNNGRLSFGKEVGKTIENGDYYLAEIDAPDGYVIREDLVHVYVNKTNIYVDAGVEDDGVKVMRSVGTLVGTMHEFGINNDLDETLYNIVVTPQLYIKGTDDQYRWVDQSPLYHLNHSSNGVHKYVATPGSGTPADDYITDIGWSRLVIRQCQEHESDSKTSYKEKLGDRDISNLFTREATILISNDKHRAGAYIDGTKVMKGGSLKRGQFSFQLEPTFDAVDGPEIAEITVKNGANGSFSFGPINFTYDHLRDDPYTYIIREVAGKNKSVIYDDSYWLAKVSVSYDKAEERMDTSVVYEHYDADGVAIEEIDPQLATFTNIWNPDVPPTGDSANLAMWIGLLALSAIGILMLSRKSKKEY